MNSQDPTLLIITSEITLFLLALIIGYGIFIFRKKKSKHKELEQLAGLIKENKEKRLSHLINTFRQLSKPDDETIKSVCEQIISAEEKYYDFLIDDIYNNPALSAEEIYKAINNLVYPYELFSRPDNSVTENNSNKEPLPDIDDAIDELLSDSDEKPNDSTDQNNTNPDYDLSKTDDEIAEIPDDLLGAEDINNKDDDADKS